MVDEKKKKLTRAKAIETAAVLYLEERPCIMRTQSRDNCNHRDDKCERCSLLTAIRGYA